MHPYAKHSENAVGHRRAKKLTTGKEYAVGGTVAGPSKVTPKRAAGGEVAAKPEGKMAGGRLDKRARGGKVAKRAEGGPARKRDLGGGLGPMGKPRKFTPSKHKPHVNVNVVHVQRGPKPGRGLAGIGELPMAPSASLPSPGGTPMPPMKRGGAVRKRLFGGPLGAGARPAMPTQAGGPPAGVGGGRPAWAGMGRPDFAGAGLPPQANPAALAALAARPALPATAMGARPFARGGRMRQGKEFGQGSGEGRLEEFHHMKGR